MSLLDEITEQVDVSDVDIRLEQRRMALISQINEYLEEKNWSQSDLAEEMGKEDSQITRLLSPTSNPTLKTLVEIESALERKLFTVHRNIKYSLGGDGDEVSRNVFWASHRWEVGRREKDKGEWTDTGSKHSVFVAST